MQILGPVILQQTNIYRPYLKQLATLFETMDLEYKLTTEGYGFECKDCRANCCLTRFYHHTLLEYLYLMMGHRDLEKKRRAEIKLRAREVCAETDTANAENLPVLRMCPLNFDGRCILYNHRPMICRLHGIPHQIDHPAKGIRHGPGCEEFTRLCGKKEYITFDRTPFYFAIAELEKDLRHEMHATQKIKLTIAQMIIA